MSDLVATDTLNHLILKTQPAFDFCAYTRIRDKGTLSPQKRSVVIQYIDANLEEIRA